MSSSIQPQHIGVCVIVLNSTKTHVLLGKRKNAYKSGYFGLPGGRLDPGESLIACAARELLEETALVAKGLQYAGVIREWQACLRSQGYDFIHFVYLCETWEGELKTVEPEKCEGWEWIPLSDLPSPILPGHKAAIELAEDFIQTATPSIIDLSR